MLKSALKMGNVIDFDLIIRLGHSLIIRPYKVVVFY